MHHRAGGRVEDYDFSQGTEDFKQQVFVQKALQGQPDDYGDKYAGPVAIEEENYFYVSGPIFDDEDNVVGAVLVGESLNTLVRQIFEETLAPPSTATKGRSGSPSTRPSASISARSRCPAARSRTCWASWTMEACARWAQPKASST